MAYTPNWMRLPDALKRFVSLTGVSEEQAKIDLCHAIADQKINVRVRVAASHALFSGDNVGVPPYLTTDDLDWERSCPLPPKRWRIGPAGPQSYTWISGWEYRSLDLIEVATADVIEVLCGGEADKTQPPTSAAPSASRHPRAKAKVAWKMVEFGLREEIKKRGFPDDDNDDPKWRCQADVERWAREFINARKEHIGESRLREKISDMLKSIKANKGQ